MIALEHGNRYRSLLPLSAAFDILPKSLPIDRSRLGSILAGGRLGNFVENMRVVLCFINRWV